MTMAPNQIISLSLSLFLSLSLSLSLSNMVQDNAIVNSPARETCSSPSPAICRRLWHVVRVLLHMIGKGFSKQKLIMELQFLLRRSKLAGKALSNFLTFNISGHHKHGCPYYYNHSSFSCKFMDPEKSFYAPREVEFSCSNTPFFSSMISSSRKKRINHSGEFGGLDVAAVARVFDILNEVSDSEASSSAPSPSPALMLSSATAWNPVRQLRITDSPFPVKDEEGGDGRVDVAAEDFIKRFYERLRRQPAATPESAAGRHRRREV